MPRLARYHIKTGLINLMIALVMALLIAAQPVLQLPSELYTLRSVYIHLIVVGWLTQLIFGVAYWMFPKYSKTSPHRSESLGWAVYILLNTGLLLRVIAEPLNALHPDANGIGGLLALSALLQLLAGWSFIANTWGRIRER